MLIAIRGLKKRHLKGIIITNRETLLRLYLEIGICMGVAWRMGVGDNHSALYFF